MDSKEVSAVEDSADSKEDSVDNKEDSVDLVDSKEDSAGITAIKVLAGITASKVSVEVQDLAGCRVVLVDSKEASVVSREDLVDLVDRKVVLVDLVDFDNLV